jgi:Helix-turn-helix domain
MPPITQVPLWGRYLLFEEREEIAILHARQLGRGIARRVGRSPSTISRELRRNASSRSYGTPYRATTAQWHAERRASRPKISKLAANNSLREYVQDRLAGRRASCGPAGAVDRLSPPAPGRTGAGPGRGARSRSRTGCLLNFPDDEPMRTRSREAL